MKKETEKKTKKQEETEEKNKIELEEQNESELEEEIEETSEEEESKLEDKIEDTEDRIKDTEFHEFLKPSAESFSPVLERAETPSRESLEQDVGFGSISATEQEDQQIQYNPVNYDENYTREPERDIGSSVEESRKIRETFSVGQPAPINLETVGRDLRPQLRDVSLVNLESQELRKPQGTLEEKYVQPEKIDPEKVGREKTPRREVQKYEVR